MSSWEICGTHVVFQTQEMEKETGLSLTTFSQAIFGVLLFEKISIIYEEKTQMSLSANNLINKSLQTML